MKTLAIIFFLVGLSAVFASPVPSGIGLGIPGTIGLGIAPGVVTTGLGVGLGSPLLGVGGLGLGHGIGLRGGLGHGW